MSIHQSDREFWGNPDNHFVHYFFPAHFRASSRLAGELTGLLATAALFMAKPILLVIAFSHFRQATSAELTQFGFVLIGLLSLVFAACTRLAIRSYASSKRFRVLLAAVWMSLLLPLFAISFFVAEELCGYSFQMSSHQNSVSGWLVGGFAVGCIALAVAFGSHFRRVEADRLSSAASRAGAE